MKSKQLGITLMELMIVVAILGIISAIAYPAYQDYVTNARRADSQGALLAASNAMERYFTRNGTYVGAAAGTEFPSTAPEGDAMYNLSVAASTQTTYTLRATPIAGTVMAGDGYFEVSSTGARRWDKNNDGDTADAGENCWEESC